jgi:hypothetical protein
MTPADLKQTIENQKTNGALKLTGTALSSTSIQNLFAAHLPDGQLLISPYQVTQKSDSVLVIGQTSYRRTNNVQVEAEFFPVDQTVEAVVTIHPDIQQGETVSWNFPQNFPELAQTFYNQLTITGPQFILDSREEGTAGTPAHLAQGLNFRGTLSFPDFLKPIAWLLNQTQQGNLNGTITLNNEAPELNLAVEAVPGVTLGFLQLEVSLQLQSQVLPSTAGDGGNLIIPSLSLLSSVELLTATQTHTIWITAQIPPGPPGLLSFVADLGNLSVSDLTELSSLVHGANLNQLPPEIKLADALRLARMSFIVSPSNMMLVNVSLEIHSAEPWTIIENILEIDLVRISFVVENPTDQNSRRVHITIFGEIQIYEIVMDSSLTLPEKLLTASLAPGATASISDLIAKALPDATLPELDITGLRAAADFSQGAYAFQLEIVDDWQIVELGPGEALSVTDILMNIQRPGAGEKTTALLVGKFIIGSAQLFISASNSDPKAGWAFAGGTVDNSALDIGKLADDIAHWFGVQVPDAIRSVQLKNLQLSMTTGTKIFDFTCTGLFTLSGEDVEIDAVVHLEENATTQKFDKHFGGTIKLHSAQDNNATREIDFTLTFDDNPQATTFTATWDQKGGPLEFADIAKGLGFSSTDIPSIPPSLDLGLTDASFTFDFTKKELVLSATSANYGSAIFMAVKNDSGQWQFLFGLAVEQNISLSEIPLVGHALAKIEKLSVSNFQFLIASKIIPASMAGQLSSLIKDSSLKLPTTDIPAGLSFSSSLSWGSNSTTFSIQMDGNSSQTPPPGPPARRTSAPLSSAQLTEAPANAPDNAKWFSLQKSFGPFTFRRIGLKYQDGSLYFLLDAALSAAGLTISLNGLSVGASLDDLKSKTFKPKFNLSGLGLDFANGPVQIGGAFLAVPESALSGGGYRYDGGVVVQAENFSLMGLGSYADHGGHPSMFAYVMLTSPLGGPAFFFVTGLAAGFGYNRTLRIPAQDEVMNFPLLQGASQPSALGGNSPDPLQILAVLEGQTGGKAWIEEQPGQDWLAAGVQFTSFDVIRTNAVLIVEFGKTFEIAVVGLSAIKLPQEGPETYAYAELQLEVIVDPAAGIFSATAVLTPNSYLIDPACHLTGGFAFYVWYGGAHEGDFVLTIGGYHPAFSPSPWYPKEPRLGFNWRVSNKITIKGDAYFALTPSNVMAGGGLEVVYQSGSLQAWFKAYADMIIGWKPFSFYVTMDLSIGVSYRADFCGLKKTFKVELGVTVELWGPPTTGKVHVNWSIISFTVSFNSGKRRGTPALSWDEFKTLLPSAPPSTTPAPEAGNSDPVICQITANRGVINQIKNNDGTTTWVVRAEGFQFTTESAVPATEIHLSTPGPAIIIQTGTTLSIRPMKKSGLASKHIVTLTSLDDNKVQDLNNWTYTQKTRGVPEALWGLPLPRGQTAPPQARVLPNQLVGLQNAGVKFQLPSGPPPINIATAFTYFMVDEGKSNNLPLSPTAEPPASGQPERSDGSLEVIQNSLMKDSIVTLRTQIYEAITGIGLKPGTDGTLDNLSQQAASAFEASPMLASPGDAPPA